METFKLVESIAVPVASTDEHKQIESVNTVEVKETFTIASLKSQVTMIDNQIAQLEERKSVLVKKIDEVALALNLTIS